MTTGQFPPSYLLAALSSFDSGSRKRGEDYARRGYAKVAINSENLVAGICRNSSGQSYRCRITLTGTRFAASCTCPVSVFCKHCAAVLITAANAPQPTQSRRSVNNWQTLVSELGATGQQVAAVVEPPRPLALMFTLEFDRAGHVSLTVRPATTGKTGRWVTSRVTWRHLLSGGPDDPHDERELDLVGHVGRTLLTDRRYAYGSSIPDTLSLKGASDEFWKALRRADEAGIELIAATSPGQPKTVELTSEFSTALHVQRTDDGLLVDLQVTFEDSVLPAGVTLTTGRPTPSGIFAIDGDHLILGPIPELTLTEARLLETGQSIPVPADQIEDFSAALPAITAARVVDIDEGAIVPQIITGPRLVLALEVFEDLFTLADWLIEYTINDEPRAYSLHDPPLETGFRDPAREEALWDDAAVDLASIKSAIGYPIDRENTNVELDDIGSALLFDLAIPGIRERGVIDVRVVGDASFRRATNQPTLHFGPAETDESDERTDWFDLKITVDVDGTAVPIAILIERLSYGEKYLVLPDGTYFELDIPQLETLRTLLDEARELGEINGTTVSKASHNVTLWEELLELGVVDEQLADWQRRIRTLSRAQPPHPVAPPENLNASLRPYQQDGLDWLAFLWDNELGGILADDMGLGKTVQSLAMIGRAVAERPDARFLVIAPTSVVPNWAAEAGKFLPGVPVTPVTSTTKRLGIPLADAIGDASIVVASYALLRLDYDSYAAIEWAGVIFDEAQFLKNHHSQVHQAARKLPAPVKLAITGTPMENRIMELWSLVSITAPGLFSSPKRFKEHFAGPIERGNAPERLDVLRRRLKPIMLRRTKDQVLTDLPPKQEQVLDLALEPAHRKIYDTFLAHERQQLLGLLDDFENNRIQVLRALTRLRQLSLHPGLVDDEHAAVKSAKISYLAEQLPILIDEGHSALVFSSFTGFLRKVAERLTEAGVPHSYLDGSMPATARAKQIEEFTSGQTGVFLISLKAGGFGLNLTNADYCFMADPWWNPAAESQAVDRTHRIGQQRPVTVYRMVSEGTIEEKVIELQTRKRELFSALIDDGAQFSGAITADDVRALLD